MANYRNRIKELNSDLHDSIEGIIDQMPDTLKFLTETANNSLFDWNPWKELYLDLENISLNETWHEEYLEYCQSEKDEEISEAKQTTGINIGEISRVKQMTGTTIGEISSVKPTTGPNIGETEIDALLNSGMKYFENDSKIYKLDELSQKYKVLKSLAENANFCTDMKHFSKDQIQEFFNEYPALSWTLMALHNNARVDGLLVGRIDDILILSLTNEQIEDLLIATVDIDAIFKLLKEYSGGITTKFATRVISGSNKILLQQVLTRNLKVFLQHSVLKHSNQNTFSGVLSYAKNSDLKTNQESALIIGAIKWKLFCKEDFKTTDFSPYVGYFITQEYVKESIKYYDGQLVDIDGTLVHPVKYILENIKLYTIWSIKNIISIINKCKELYSGIMEDAYLYPRILWALWGKVGGVTEWKLTIDKVLEKELNLALSKASDGIVSLVMDRLQYFENNFERIFENSLSSLGYIFQHYKGDIAWNTIITKIILNNSWKLSDSKTYRNYNIELMTLFVVNSRNHTINHFISRVYENKIVELKGINTLAIIQDVVKGLLKGTDKG